MFFAFASTGHSYSTRLVRLHNLKGAVIAGCEFELSDLLRAE
jgi:hypothetical protein